MTYKGITFNGDSYSDGFGFKIWCNFNRTNYWLSDRLLVLLQVTSESPTCEVQLWCQPLGFVLYTQDASGYCIIDITEIARTYQGNNILVGYGQQDLSQQAEDEWDTVIDRVAKGIINPAGVLIPPHPLSANGVTIAPPSKMISADDDGYATFGATLFEFRANSQWDIIEYWGESSQDTFICTQPACQLDDTAIKEMYITPDAHRPTGIGQLIRMTPMRCDVQYAQVDWVSFTGVHRVHIFEVVKSKTITKNAYSLLNIEGEYTEIKGREDSFTLRIDGLNAYDLWYYADILHSSNVQVCFGARSGTPVWRRVKIDDSTITIPDGNAGTDGKLEINVKWHDYDAISL